MIAEQDRQANARAHADMEFLAREVASLRMARRRGRDPRLPALRAARRCCDDLERASARTTRHARTPDAERLTAPRRLEVMTSPALEQINAALATVNDPEIQRPITDLGMVEHVDVDDAGRVARHGAADRRRLPAEGHHHPRRHRRASAQVAGVTGVDAHARRDDRRAARRAAGAACAAARPSKEIPFAQPGSLTKVFAIASGKGGVGKSSVTVNLALAMAKQGLQGRHRRRRHLRPLGAGDARRRATPGPTQVEDMIMPVPTAVRASR